MTLLCGLYGHVFLPNRTMISIDVHTCQRITHTPNCLSLFIYNFLRYELFCSHICNIDISTINLSLGTWTHRRPIVRRACLSLPPSRSIHDMMVFNRTGVNAWLYIYTWIIRWCLLLASNARGRNCSLWFWKSPLPTKWFQWLHETSFIAKIYMWVFHK